MSKPKHTPGPWRVSTAFESYTICQGEATRVAKVFTGGTSVAVSQADAILIAAAPDMLQLLKHFIDGGLECEADNESHPDDCWHCAAVALIAKAEGKS